MPSIYSLFVGMIAMGIVLGVYKGTAAPDPQACAGNTYTLASGMAVFWGSLARVCLRLVETQN